MRRRIRTYGVVVAGALVGACLEPHPDYIESAGGGESGGTTGDGGSSGGPTSDDGATGTSGTTGSDGTDGSSGDTTTGAPAGCSALWAETGWTLEEPEHLVDVSSQGFDGDPYLTADGLTLYFASDRPGGAGGSVDIYFATRPDFQTPFASIDELAEINSNALDYTFAVTEDGLTAYFTSDRSGGAGDVDLWQTVRQATADPWQAPVPVEELNSADAEYDPFAMPDGLTLYYNVAAGNAQNNFVATRPSLDEAFEPGTPLSINSNQGDDSPTLSADGLVIVFGSDRPGGEGDRDLWYATRPDPGADWGEPRVVPVVNTGSREGESHLRSDACELLFTSDRAGGLGGWDLYRTVFVPP